MVSRSTSKVTSLTFVSYCKTLWLSFTRPVIYPSKAPLFGTAKAAVLVLIINCCLFILTKTTASIIITHNPSLFFQTTFQVLQLLPLTFIIAFLITGTFHFLAKFLGGFGLFKHSFNAVVYSSFPLILAWVPILSIILYILVIYYLLSTFTKVHHFLFAKSLISVMVPIMIVVIVLTMLGLVDVSLLYSII